MCAAPPPPLPGFVPQEFAAVMGCLTLKVDADTYYVCLFGQLSVMLSSGQNVLLGRMTGYAGGGTFTFGGGELLVEW